MSKRARLLYLHASEDEALRRALEAHLSALVREGLIEGWHVGQMPAGADISQHMAAEVAQADIVLLLLSAVFMSSPQCQALLEQVQREQAARQLQVVPILARPVDFRGMGLDGLQALPRNGQAVTLWSNQDAAWLEVAQALRGLVTGGASPPAAVPTSSTRITSPIERGTPMSIHNDHSVHIGGNVTGSAIVTGDGNQVNVHHQQVTLPPPESVDLRAELREIRQILTALQSSDKRRMERALEEAAEEAEESVPRKEVIGESVEKALTIAKQAGAFAEAAAKLQPHVTSVTAWLGAAWHKLLPLVGSFV